MNPPLANLPQVLEPAKEVLNSLLVQLAFEASYHESTPYDGLVEKMNVARKAIEDVLQDPFLKEHVPSLVNPLIVTRTIA